MQRVPHDRSPLGPASLDGAPLAATRTGTHAYWLYKQAVQHACRLDPHILVRPKQWPSMLGWSLNILAGAALAYERRVDTEQPVRGLIGHFTRGNLLGPPLRT